MDSRKGFIHFTKTFQVTYYFIISIYCHIKKKGTSKLKREHKKQDRGLKKSRLKLKAMHAQTTQALFTHITLNVTLLRIIACV